MQTYIDKLKKLDRKWLIAIAAVIVLGLGFFVWNSQKKYNPAKDIEVSFTGYNGSGYASYNRTAVERKIFEYIGKKEGLKEGDIARIEANNMDFASMLDIYSKAAKAKGLADLVDFDISKMSGLSNGDKVTVTVTVPSKDIKVKAVKKEFTVKGLKKVKTVKAKDIAKDIKVKFVGYNGLGQAKITSKKYKDEVVQVDDNGKLKNGDQIKLNVAKFVQTGEGSKFSGTHYIKVKVAGLTDLTKISNIDDVIKLNDDYANNENKTDETVTNTLEKLHTYVSESSGSVISSSYGSDDVDESVSINGQVESQDVSIYTVYKVTTKYSFEDEATTTYKAYGLRSLSVEGDKVDITSKSTDTDGISDESDDTLPIIQKRIEQNSILIK